MASAAVAGRAATRAPRLPAVRSGAEGACSGALGGPPGRAWESRWRRAALAGAALPRAGPDPGRAGSGCSTSGCGLDPADPARSHGDTVTRLGNHSHLFLPENLVLYPSAVFVAGPLRSPDCVLGVPATAFFPVTDRGGHRARRAPPMTRTMTRIIDSDSHHTIIIIRQ